MTRKQLERFVKVRNKSGFASNLQFQIDANECGFKVLDLGDVLKVADGYIWHTPHGRIRERHGVLSFENDPPMTETKKKALSAINVEMTTALFGGRK